MSNKYCPSKQDLIEHIQTLNGLIDGQDDSLGEMLTPIVAMLEKMVGPLIAPGVSMLAIGIHHEVTLTPAYERDYKSAEAAREAFLSGKDWILNDLSSRWDGKPCSKNDFQAGQTIRLRYNKLRSVVRVEL